MDTDIRVDRTETGWVAYRPGAVLAARAPTKEDAVARYERAVQLVQSLAARAKTRRSSTTGHQQPS